MIHTLPKRERLYLRREIEQVFTSGEGFMAYPLRVVYTFVPPEREARCSILVSVSKRYFKRANKRNQIKRYVREAYRCNKQEWLEALGQKDRAALVAFVSVAKELPTQQQITGAMRKALSKLIERLPE